MICLDQDTLDNEVDLIRMRAEPHPGHSVSLKIDRFRQSLRDDVRVYNISLVRRNKPGTYSGDESSHYLSRAQHHSPIRLHGICWLVWHVAGCLS